VFSAQAQEEDQESRIPGPCRSMPLPPPRVRRRAGARRGPHAPTWRLASAAGRELVAARAPPHSRMPPGSSSPRRATGACPSATAPCNRTRPAGALGRGARAQRQEPVTACAPLLPATSRSPWRTPQEKNRRLRWESADLYFALREQNAQTIPGYERGIRHIIGQFSLQKMWRSMTVIFCHGSVKNRHKTTFMMKFHFVMY
jgi:hypothetical protein